MIIFRNDGLIDLTAVKTMGVSVKEEGSIGYFGTGLKFAVATILRNGGHIVIWRDDDRHEFGTRATDVRGKPFDVVTLDGIDIGFTTQLGRDWEPWMAFREMACNALDEGGRYFASEVPAGPGCGGETIIEVTGGGIDRAYSDRHDIIIEAEPLEANDAIEIHPGPSNYIYYRGVRVGLLSWPTVFRYNIREKIDLTEDRTFKYSFQIYDALAQGLARSADEARISAALTCGGDYLEHHLTFADNGSASEAFLKVAGGLRADLADAINANPSAMKLARTRQLSKLGPQQSATLNAIEQTRLSNATRFLNDAGYDLAEYPTIVVDDLGAGVYGLAKEGKIFIAKAAFQKGTKEVASTLLEEFVHLKTGYNDTTRQLQTWLFDELLSQAEKAAGVAL